MVVQIYVVWGPQAKRASGRLPRRRIFTVRTNPGLFLEPGGARGPVSDLMVSRARGGRQCLVCERAKSERTRLQIDCLRTKLLDRLVRVKYRGMLLINKNFGYYLQKILMLPMRRNVEFSRNVSGSRWFKPAGELGAAPLLESANGKHTHVTERYGRSHSLLSAYHAIRPVTRRKFRPFCM